MGHHGARLPGRAGWLWPPPAHFPGRLLAGFPAGDGMALTLRTDTLLNCNVGALLSDRLERCGCGIGYLASFALHEILVNAVVHGNLQVASQPSARWRAREVHARELEASLADSARGVRLVTIALGWKGAELCACIIDEGIGYIEHAANQPDPAESRKAVSRGLAIARAAARVQVLRGGSCTRMIFERLPAAGAA